MGVGDKVENTAEKIGGKVKETVGDATDNERLEAEGRGDQVAADTKQVGENVKDAVRDAQR